MFFWSFCIHSSIPLQLDEWILVEEQMMDGNNSRVLWLISLKNKYFNLMVKLREESKVNRLHPKRTISVCNFIQWLLSSLRSKVAYQPNIRSTLPSIHCYQQYISMQSTVLVRCLNTLIIGTLKKQESDAQLIYFGFSLMHTTIQGICIVHVGSCRFQSSLKVLEQGHFYWSALSWFMVLLNQLRCGW